MRRSRTPTAAATSWRRWPPPTRRSAATSRSSASMTASAKSASWPLAASTAACAWQPSGWPSSPPTRPRQRRSAERPDRNPRVFAVARRVSVERESQPKRIVEGTRLGRAKRSATRGDPRRSPAEGSAGRPHRHRTGSRVRTGGVLGGQERGAELQARLPDRRVVGSSGVRATIRGGDPHFAFPAEHRFKPGAHRLRTAGEGAARDRGVEALKLVVGQPDRDRAGR